MRNIQIYVSANPLKIGHMFYMNWFTPNSPYNHLPKYLLFLLKHPVYNVDDWQASNGYKCSCLFAQPYELHKPGNLPSVSYNILWR